MATKAELEARVAALEARLAQASKVRRAPAAKAALPPRAKRERKLFFGTKSYLLAAPSLAQFDARCAEYGITFTHDASGALVERVRGKRSPFCPGTATRVRQAYTNGKARTVAEYREYWRGQR